jgi:hypothetical protein
MGNIRIVGEASLYDYEVVKDSVIQLGGLWYWKHSPELVKVTIDGKKRLYRKESVLICYTLSRTYQLKRDCYEIAPNIWVGKKDPDTIKLEDGTYTHTSWVVDINGKRYLKSDERLIRTVNGNFTLKELCVQLAPEYGKEVFTENTPELTQLEDGYYFTKDLREVTYLEDGIQQFKYMSKKQMLKAGENRYMNGVFARFKDRSNPQLDRVECCWADRNSVVPVSNFGHYVLRGMEAEIEAAVIEIQARESAKLTESARNKCNTNFSDKDEVENIAKKIDPNYRIWGGKERLFGDIGEPVLSKQFNLTGGLGYGFGVEVETSAGVIPKDIAYSMGFAAVGDRSIGSAEYVTPVLQGNKGINYIKKLAEICAAHTFVDDRCAIHVHVGSPPVVGASNWTLKFDRRFAMASIKLGCLIEEDLYKMLPKSRNPYNRHCHSIMRYRNINEDNWKHYLAAFVFGPEENWGDRLNFNNYMYGTGSFTKESRLATWCGGRYKWLNLVRAYSQCSSRTIEFRIFSPSVNYDKIYNYILISLAFTYVADNYFNEVMAGDVNLLHMIELAYSKHPELIDRLKSFITSRTEKFKRVVYTKTKPDQIVSIEPIILKQTLPSTPEFW